MVSFIFHVSIGHPTFKMVIASILLLLVIPFATPLSFNLSTFSPNDGNIFYEGSATVSSDAAIQLTPNAQDANTTNSVGRATYTKQPLRLLDKASGNLTDFSTNFTFVINSLGNGNYGDGFAFFLAPNGSKYQKTDGGGGLGLMPVADNQALNYTGYPIIAVEFDIFLNTGWDLSPEHVGIDINSVKSVVEKEWGNARDSIMNGTLHEAMITYDSTSQNLSVVLCNFSDGIPSFMLSLSYGVNLSEVLQEEYVTFGFSGAAGVSGALHSIKNWSFRSSLEDINRTALIPPVAPPVWQVPPNSASINGNKNMVIGLAVGGSVFVLVVGLTIYLFRGKGRGTIDEVGEGFDDELADQFEQGAGPKKFTYNELACATSNFAEYEKLGEGGFGGVYKGFLKEMSSYIAVKRVSKGSSQGVKEYASEVKIISRLRHKNLVQLFGWCHQKQELLLVYELMPNGSLDHHLFKGKSLLDWVTRLRIVQGLASALRYLHEEWEQCVVHRDIKSSNVMLDANFNAKLGDFGLARLVDHEKGSQTTVLAGTMGYMAPECMITGKASKETDVFSFGVVALEIATGRKPINPKAEQGQIHLVEWAWRLYGIGKLLDAADPQLGNEFDSKEMEQLMIVGLWCAHPISELRPSIKQAIRVLGFEAPLPELPMRMPVPMYCIPSTDMPLSPYGTILSGKSYTYDENTSSSKYTSSSQESSTSTSALLYSK